MNKIHPLLIVALLIILASFVHVKKSTFQDALINENSRIGTLEVSLKDIVQTKEKWQNSKKKLDNIVKNSRYKNVEFKQDERKKSIVLTANNLNPTQFRTLVNKLLNSYIIIKKFELNKEKEMLSLRVEIDK